MKKANIFANLNDLSEEIKEVVENELIKHNYSISYDHDKDADLNVVIGGDGRFMRSVHDSEFSSIPFMGINTGHLGFYNDVNPKNVHDAIERLVDGQYFINNLRVIECTVNTGDKEYKYMSINEIVLKARYTSIIKFDLYVDDVKLQSFAGDGIVFSTPSGSTAYNLSAGGAILYQNIDAFQITPLAPIRSALHKSLDKALVVPKDTIIKLITKDLDPSSFSLGVDGILKEHNQIESIEIKLSESIIKKIVFDKDWFWINVRDKFI